jgi:hypothetical protein
LLLPGIITLVAGLLPAWRATGFDVLGGLRLSSTGGAIRSRMQRVLLVVQIAISVSLLTTASYLVHMFSTMPAADGLLRDDVLVADVRFLNLGFTAEREISSRQSVLEQSANMPGITAAALGQRLLSQLNSFAARQVTADWFHTVGIRFRAGRAFAAGESNVAVVNEIWAAALGGTQRAIGARIVVDRKRTVDVIGVVENAYERIAWSQDVPSRMCRWIGFRPVSSHCIFVGRAPQLPHPASGRS